MLQLKIQQLAEAKRPVQFARRYPHISDLGTLLGEAWHQLVDWDAMHSNLQWLMNGFGHAEVRNQLTMALLLLQWLTCPWVAGLAPIDVLAQH